MSGQLPEECLPRILVKLERSTREGDLDLFFVVRDFRTGKLT